MADKSKLVSARDKLNADIGILLNASSVTQDQVDSLTAEVTSVDSDVQALINTPPPPPVPLDFSAFDAAVAAFKGDTNLAQANVDAATQALIDATV